MLTDSGETLTRVRSGILWLLVLGMTGTGVELLLMGHTEDFWQLIPLLLIGLSLAALGWIRWSRSRMSRTVFRVLSLATLVSGAAGSILHYRGNVEFELEMTPGLGGLALFKEAMTGATPALAPGTMILLGILGLLYTLGLSGHARHSREEDL